MLHVEALPLLGYQRPVSHYSRAPNVPILHVHIVSKIRMGLSSAQHVEFPQIHINQRYFLGLLGEEANSTPCVPNVAVAPRSNVLNSSMFLQPYFHLLEPSNVHHYNVPVESPILANVILTPLG